MGYVSNKVLLLLLLQTCIVCAKSQSPYLSTLKANKNFPLYSTYAAAMERSNFILDEGYHFQYYIDDAGADFTTDTGGDIGLGFLMNGSWVYLTKDMYKPPVITSSYPDLVKYELYPFKDIKVDLLFLVYSSVQAVLKVQITNLKKTGVHIKAVPFMRKAQNPFHSVSALKNGFLFQHEENPDSWTINHKVPYTDSILNYFSISIKPDKLITFNSELGESIFIPFSDQLNKKQQLLFFGRALLPGKERMKNAQTTLKMQAFASNDDTRLITENIPVPGSLKSSLTNDGYYNFDLGLIDSTSDVFNITMLDAQSSSYFSGDINKKELHNIRKDILLESKTKIPPSAKNFTVSSKKGNTLVLSWNQLSPDVYLYDIYRRIYPNLSFTMVARGIKGKSWIDGENHNGRIVSYIIIARDKKGSRSIHSEEAYNVPKQTFSDAIKANFTNVTHPAQNEKILALPKSIYLKAGAKFNYTIQRSVAAVNTDRDSLIKSADKLFKLHSQKFIEANQELFKKIPRPAFNNFKQEALYWSANNMMRQVFYPPEGKSSYNYYVFSREPTWGWGHGGQVFHESIAMLAYAYVDPVSAMNSQRVYKERQYPNGYINYRTGSYLDEIIEHNGQLTTSAPWYCWLNWEVYQITKDKVFLSEMYESSKKFYEFIVSNRDSDGDGLCEWGGEAVLESVRDALVAVWDQVGFPSNFESVDLNCMLVNEARSLAQMASSLGKSDDAKRWNDDADTRASLINNTFWDEQNGFYYNVDKKSNSFTFKIKDDLKRDEIIGFLPLWAGIATKYKATRLLKTLVDTSKFWRPYGIPSLSAKDSYYNPKGYWNGPVWVEWNYLIMQGLLNYGFKKEARLLVNNISKGMIDVLKKDHNLWEFYSPDEPWGGYHKTYIWAGIINRMMMDTAF